MGTTPSSSGGSQLGGAIRPVVTAAGGLLSGAWHLFGGLAKFAGVLLCATIIVAAVAFRVAAGPWAIGFWFWGAVIGLIVGAVINLAASDNYAGWQGEPIHRLAKVTWVISLTFLLVNWLIIPDGIELNNAARIELANKVMLTAVPLSAIAVVVGLVCAARPVIGVVNVLTGADETWIKDLNQAVGKLTFWVPAIFLIIFLGGLVTNPAFAAVLFALGVCAAAFTKPDNMKVEGVVLVLIAVVAFFAFGVHRDIGKKIEGAVDEGAGKDCQYSYEQGLRKLNEASPLWKVIVTNAERERLKCGKKEGATAEACDLAFVNSLKDKPWTDEYLNARVRLDNAKFDCDAAVERGDSLARGIYDPLVTPMESGVCTADTWDCQPFGACVEGSQSRTCTQTSECTAVDTPKPPTTQACLVPAKPAPQKAEPAVNGNGGGGVTMPPKKALPASMAVPMATDDGKGMVKSVLSVEVPAQHEQETFIDKASIDAGLKRSDCLTFIRGSEEWKDHGCASVQK